MPKKQKHVEFSLEPARMGVHIGNGVLAVAVVLDKDGEYSVFGCANPGDEASKEVWLDGIRQNIRERQAVCVAITAGAKRGIYSEEGGREMRRRLAEGLVSTSMMR